MRRNITFKTLWIGASLAAILIGCGKSEKIETKEMVRPVQYIRIRGTKDGLIRTFSGVAKAVIESKLSFKVNGTIQRIPVKVGDRVKKGQLIAQLDPTDYQIKVQETQASLAKAHAEARNASANYERVRALYENSNASRNELDAARAGAESTRAAVQYIEKQLEFTRRRLSYTRIKAPADCAIASVPVDQNENVSPGQPIVIITCGPELEVNVGVPEMIISDIYKRMPVTVSFDAMPGMPFQAVVTEVGVTSIGLETTFPVTVRLMGTAPRLRPGMAAEVAFNIKSGSETAHILVPPVSVGEDRGGRFVFVVDKTAAGFGIAYRRPVKVGKLTAGGLEIIEGLNAGDFVITAGISRLEDGIKVKLE